MLYLLLNIMSHIAKVACHIFRESNCRDIMREALTIDIVVAAANVMNGPRKNVPIVPKPHGLNISVVDLIVWSKRCFQVQDRP